eukprot:1154533-Pelagomonas_calceolata.AAC.3
MKRVENEHRREVQYKTGDLVMLSTKNIKQNGPGVKKLMPVYMGPFEVEHMVGKAAVKLRLPEEWNRIHNVFHVTLTKPYL